MGSSDEAGFAVVGTYRVLLVGQGSYILPCIALPLRVMVLENQNSKREERNIVEWGHRDVRNETLNKMIP